MYSVFERLNVNIFGASHADSIGVEIIGLPNGIAIDAERLQAFVDRRRSANNAWSTSRREGDVVIIEKGIIDGKTDGVFRAVITNSDSRSSDYSDILSVPRPSHADFTATVKYGGKVDLRGGGKYSGRMTAPLCIAGGVAVQMLESYGIHIGAYVSSVGEVNAPSYKQNDITYDMILAARVRGFCSLNEESNNDITDVICRARDEKDSIGGSVECIVFGLPIGLGDALFEGLEGRISGAVFAIPAVKAVEFGKGVDFAMLRGSQANDCLCIQEGKVRTLTNNCGGINGGISNGMPLTLRVTFKPTPSIGQPQQSVNLATNEETTIEIKGRHDACIVPRAVAPVEAAVALALLDCIIASRG